MDDLHSIRHAAILAGLAGSELEELANIAREQRVAKGDRLFARGDEADQLFIVEQGRFVLTIQARALGDPTEIAIEAKVAGDALGWSALVEPFRSVYTAYCVQDGSVVAFPRGDLVNLMSSDTDLGYRFSVNLSQLIGNRLRALQDLWVEEVEQSSARVNYWSHNKLSGECSAAIAQPRQRARGRRHASPRE